MDTAHLTLFMHTWCRNLLLLKPHDCCRVQTQYGSGRCGLLCARCVPSYCCCREAVPCRAIDPVSPHRVFCAAVLAAASFASYCMRAAAGLAYAAAPSPFGRDESSCCHVVFSASAVCACWMSRDQLPCQLFPEVCCVMLVGCCSVCFLVPTVILVCTCHTLIRTPSSPPLIFSCHCAIDFIVL